MSVEELRRIAAEAGIDPGATNRAIQEIMAGEEPDPHLGVDRVPWGPRQEVDLALYPAGSWAGGAIGTAMGFLAAFAGGGRGFDGLAHGWAGWASEERSLYLVARAVECMKRGAQLDFSASRIWRSGSGFLWERWPPTCYGRTIS